MSELLNALLNAKRVVDVTDALQAIASVRRIAWKPVGDRENNLATINLGSDPAAGVIERVTNALDSVLEREWKDREEPANINSPRKAVQQWYGLVEGRLANIDSPRDPEIARLSERVRVTLHDSERDDRPTVDVRDYGIGIKAEEFATSILSLQGSRKLRKLFLAGAFGQGGSTSLSYSPYTTIVSRAATMGEASPSPVAATVVRFNPGDTLMDKHGLYEYMIDHATGQPFEFEVTLEEFEPGTLVRMVTMDLGKYRNTMTAPTGSLWYLAHHYLFDPVLPFRIQEERNNPSNGQNHLVTGNHRLLSQGENTEYQRQAILTFRDGTVRISWWGIIG